MKYLEPDLYCPYQNIFVKNTTDGTSAALHGITEAPI